MVRAFGMIVATPLVITTFQIVVGTGPILVEVMVDLIVFTLTGGCPCSTGVA
jgi:hypothetical protein